MENPLACPRQATILVIDDTPDNLSLMSEVLGGDYKVKAADSGARALKLPQATE